MRLFSLYDDGAEVVCTVRRGREEKELCLRLTRKADAVRATGSYLRRSRLDKGRGKWLYRSVLS